MIVLSLFSCLVFKFRVAAFFDLGFGSRELNPVVSTFESFEFFIDVNLEVFESFERISENFEVAFMGETGKESFFSLWKEVTWSNLFSLDFFLLLLGVSIMVFSEIGIRPYRVLGECFKGRSLEIIIL